MAITIAIVQQNGNPGDIAENRVKALAFAEQALERGADIIVYHEGLLTGYVENPRESAEPADGPTSQAFRNLLQRTGARVVYGLTERDGDNLFISAPVVSADGVVANYRKTHLWWKADGLRYEPTHFTPGDRLVTFDCGPHRIGLMICYDGDFPETARSYAHLGCEVVLWLNNRGSRGHAEVKDVASRNSLIVAASCCCGLDEAGRECRGGSNITDATGELLEELWDREGIVTAKVHPEKVPELRANNPWYRGLRPELYVNRLNRTVENDPD